MKQQAMDDIPTFDLFNNIYFYIEDVFKGLYLLKGNWLVSPDQIPWEFLYRIQSIIAYLLFTLLKLSLDEGTFLTILKLSSVNPIPKSSNLSDVSNYRPISLESHTAKLFESLF